MFSALANFVNDEKIHRDVASTLEQHEGQFL